MANRQLSTFGFGERGASVLMSGHGDTPQQNPQASEGTVRSRSLLRRTWGVYGVASVDADGSIREMYMWRGPRFSGLGLYEYIHAFVHIRSAHRIVLS